MLSIQNNLAWIARWSRGVIKRSLKQCKIGPKLLLIYWSLMGRPNTLPIGTKS